LTANETTERPTSRKCASGIKCLMLNVRLINIYIQVKINGLRMSFTHETCRHERQK